MAHKMKAQIVKTPKFILPYPFPVRVNGVVVLSDKYLSYKKGW